MTADKNNTINQLKWIYSALSGICVTYFFALFSGSSSINSSFFLNLSTISFAICLPIFISFSTVHIILIENKENSERCIELLSQHWVTKITSFALILICVAFTSLIGYFSSIAMIGFIFSIGICYHLLKKFFNNKQY
ncbi:TPA: hypothetical protein ACX6RS_000493 [Photobacterium damselae]